MKVMVIGAGIGGLTAALSLHAAGIDTQVYNVPTSGLSASASIYSRMPCAS